MTPSETPAMPWLLTFRPMRRLQSAFVFAALILASGTWISLAQEDAAGPDQPAEPAAAEIPSENAASGASEPAVAAPKPPTVWELIVQGGIFMIPIGFCSIIVLAFALERMIGLRRNRIVPPKLLVALRKLDTEANGIDPRLAYDVCQEHPSPLANVVRAAILKIGRPHSELEKTVEDAVSREADEMAHNLRPINVAISIAPLLGLLGTVQGMILAFMVTSTTTATGTAKGQELAQGIYVALVTTFAGLCVAIPAIMIANMLEGRIDRLLRVMEDVFLELLPQFERFEGKLRVTRKTGPEEKSGVLLKGTSPKPVAVPAPAQITSPPPAPTKTAPSSSRPAAKPVISETVVAPLGHWGVKSSRGDAERDENQ